VASRELISRESPGSSKIIRRVGPTAKEAHSKENVSGRWGKLRGVVAKSRSFNEGTTRPEDSEKSTTAGVSQRPTRLGGRVRNIKQADGRRRVKPKVGHPKPSSTTSRWPNWRRSVRRSSGLSRTRRSQQTRSASSTKMRGADPSGSRICHEWRWREALAEDRRYFLAHAENLVI
jgi:hypothetical protein